MSYPTALIRILVARANLFLPIVIYEQTTINILGIRVSVYVSQFLGKTSVWRSALCDGLPPPPLVRPSQSERLEDLEKDLS